jgi:phage baseplate assembly protein W
MAKRVMPQLLNWPLLPYPDAAGQLNYPTLEESVRQSIRVILQTRPSEQLMRPLFGAGLENYVHQQNTLLTRRRITDLIRESLKRWERRIILSRVEVSEVPNYPTRLRVEIGYQLKRTGATGRLGLTMDLEA